MATPSELREAFAALNALAARDLGRLMRSLRDGDNVQEALHDILPALIDTYGTAASTVAADWYDELRETQGVGGRFVAIPADIEDTGAHALIGWALDEAVDDGSLVALLEGGLQRRVVNFGRFTITQSSYADPRADGWMRLGSGSNCPFCDMLISRGAVYSEATVTFASHDHCNCIAAPAFRGKPRPVRLDEEGRRLDASSRADRTDDAKRATSNKRVREWIANNPNAG